MLVGQPRARGDHYADDTGPRVPCAGWYADCLSQWLRHGRKDEVRHYLGEHRDAGYNVITWFPELPSGSDFWGFIAESVLGLVNIQGVWQMPPPGAIAELPAPPQRIPSSRLLQMAGGGGIPSAFAGLVRKESLPGVITSALSGESLAVSPWDQPNYYEGYEELFREMAHVFGLKLWHSMSCGDGPFQPQHVRNEHMRRIAEIHHRVGLEHVFAVTVNEPHNIGFRDASEVTEMMDVYAHHTGGQVMTFGGAPCSEIGHEIAALARNRTGWEEHSARGPGFETQAHHPWSLLREQRLHEVIAWLCAFSENTGPGDPVSVGQQNHAEAVVMLRAVEACMKSPAFAFSGKGLFSRWHGNTFHNVPGWAQIPRVIQILEDFTGRRLHMFRKLTHTGASDRFMHVDWREGMRFVQVGSEEDGIAIGLLFGENMGTPVWSDRGGQMQIVHPRTTEVTPINSGDWVDFEFARIVLLKW